MSRPSFAAKLRNLRRLLFSREKRAPVVEAREAKRLQDAGALVLDVRQAAEFRGGHIPGARNVPLTELESRLDEVPRDTPVVVHCALGSRSALAARRLQALGFNNVRDMSGGLRAWKAAELPVEGDDRKKG